MERHLRGFGEGGDGDEAEEPGIRAGLPQGCDAARPEMSHVPPSAWSRMPPAISDKPPSPVTTMRLCRGTAGGRALVIEADEEERGDCGHLPVGK